jgi:two-component system chemotaxis response regulator CheY
MRILIVDDSAMMRRLIIMSLNEMRDVEIETVEAVDGLDALEVINGLPVGIDLVLTDMNKPRADGLALLRSLRDTPELRRIPFILVTGDVSGGSARRALREGAADVIGKPFNAQALVDAVSRWIPCGQGTRVTFKTEVVSEKIRALTGACG